MSVKLARPEHRVAYAELCALVGRHAAVMTPLEILAVAANMVGKLVAMQDQRVTTPAAAMDTVVKNVEMGNREMIDELLTSEPIGSA